MTTTTLAELAERVGGRVEGDGSVSITGAASIGRAREGDITLADAPRLLRQLSDCPAAAVVVDREFPATSIPRIVVADVHAAFAQIVASFRPQHESLCEGCSPCAHIARSASVALTAAVHPFATVGDGVVVGEGAVIHTGVHVMAGCQIAEGVILFPNVVLYPGTIVGARSVIHAGAVIGAYGFGYQTVGGGARPRIAVGLCGNRLRCGNRRRNNHRPRYLRCNDDRGWNEDRQSGHDWP